MLALTLAVTMFAACGNAGGAQQKEAGGLSGSVTTAGSTSVQPLSQELADAFAYIHPGVIIDVQGGGSGQGVKAVEEDLVDFGALSRELKGEERAIVKEEYVIAKDGIAVVANGNVGVDDLTIEQLTGIFTGEIKDWSAVGGSAGKIEVVAREEGSGTRDAFNELTGVLGKDAEGKKIDNTVDAALIQGSTGAVKTTVGTVENAIGYVSLGSLDDSVKVIMVEGVAPSAATVLDGSYKVSRPFIYITAHALSPQAQAFLDFIFSAEGQAIVEESGFIAVA
jgi:phosphate transport system substrate-binding protein